MTVKDSSSHFESLESHAAANKPDKNSKKDTSTFSSNWLGRFIRRLSITKKIGYSYSLAIGIGVIGTTVGLIIGDYYQKQAQKQLAIAHQQQHLLNNLENAVMAVRSHPQQLVAVLGDSVWFDYESAKFVGNVDRVKTLLSELESFTDNHPSEIALDAPAFKILLNDCKTNTDSYAKLVKELWQQIAPANLKPAEITRAQQQVFVSMRGETAIKISVKFERLSESLTQIIAAAETQQMQANASLDTAEALRRQIIIGSMLLGAACAAALAIYTSRTIARPLEAVTKVARRVTQEANFDLQAIVTTEDEVGSLSTSLNQLIQWVGEYTQELELARQMLEQRVEERTKELTVALCDLKHTQAQLIQSEKMSGLGQMVAGIAHEINNPVNFIHGNLTHFSDYTQDLLTLVNLCQQRYANIDPEIQDHLKAIDLEFLAEDLPKVLSSMKMGTERIRQIVLSLRNFSRLDEAEMKLVDIHEGIDSTLLILNNRLKQKIEVIKKYGDLPLVACYPAQLNQVFMNIIANAIDALHESYVNGHFSFDGRGQRATPQIAIYTETVDRDRIRVRIWNNGPQIPPEIKGKLFDPFFTTKDVGKGTGLGLTICYQIIEKHGGKIEVISEPESGTEFAIALPIDTPR